MSGSDTLSSKGSKGTNEMPFGVDLRQKNRMQSLVRDINKKSDYIQQYVDELE